MKQKLAQLFVRSGTRARPSCPRRTPLSLGMEYEDIHFVSAHKDGVELSGWLIPAQREPGACVILCHGHTSTRQEMLGRAVALSKHHFTTLLFDFRARGLSGGKYCTLGLKEGDDVIGAVNYLVTRYATGPLPILAVGNSMGGAAVICAAAREKRIQAVVAEGAFASLKDVISQRARWFFGPFYAEMTNATHRMGLEQFDFDVAQICPEKEIGKIAPRPIMIIQDGLDATCPKSQSDRLYAAALHPKERWIVPGAPHVCSFHLYPSEYERRVSTFLSSVLESHMF